MKQITCERCGKKELRITKARFCLDCANERRKEAAVQSMRRLRDGIPNIKTCKRCGKEFTAKKNQQYCSEECSKAAAYGQNLGYYVARRKETKNG